MENTIKTVRDLCNVYGGGCLTNDRGNACGGACYTAEDADDDIMDTDITVVSESDDADAWELARNAAKLNNCDMPTIVCVGDRKSGDNGHQMIYAV